MFGTRFLAIASPRGEGTERVIRLAAPMEAHKATWLHRSAPHTKSKPVENRLLFIGLVG